MTLCLLQGAELSMLSVSWMHLGFLDEMQLYDLAFRVCARLGSLQTLLPVYHRRPAALHVAGTPFARPRQML